MLAGASLSTAAILSVVFIALAVFAESENVITGIGAVIGAAALVIAYCFREANRRVTTIDLFIGIVQTQVSGRLGRQENNIHRKHSGIIY